MEYVTSILWCYLEVIHCCVLSNALLPSKRTLRHRIVTVAFGGLLLCLLAYISNAINASGLTFFGYLMLSFYLFGGSWVQHALTSLLCFVFNAIFDVAILYGACALLRISLSEFVWRKLAYTTTVTIGKLISILIAWIIWKLRKRHKTQNVQNKWMVLILFFPCVSMLMLILIYTNYRNSADMSLGAMLISFAIAIANIAILYLLQKMEEQSIQEQEVLLLNQQMELQTAGILALEKSYRAQRHATHEFQHHIQVLTDLLSSHKLDVVNNYLEQLRITQTSRILCVDSRHPIIDAIINQRYQVARDHDIDFQLKVSNLSKIKIATNALVVLLSNLLDNAIEACQRIPDNRVIHCSILVIENSLFISVRNTSMPVKMIDGTIPTCKEPKVEHGYGLPNTCRILDTLGAEYTFTYESGWFQFAAEIPDCV